MPDVITFPDGKAGKVVAIQDALGNVLSGRAGITAIVSFMPTAVEYAAGDIIGVAQEVEWVDAAGNPVPVGSLIKLNTAVINIAEAAVPSGQTSFTGHFYAVTPPSARADNAAWALGAPDIAAYRGAVALGTPADVGASLYVKTRDLNEEMHLSGTTLFMELVTVGTHTPAAVARLVTLHAVLI